jgi:hypothetical protein
MESGRKYRVGDKVLIHDREGRVQLGEIMRVDGPFLYIKSQPLTNSVDEPVPAEYANLPEFAAGDEANN